MEHREIGNWLRICPRCKKYAVKKDIEDCKKFQIIKCDNCDKIYTTSFANIYRKDFEQNYSDGPSQLYKIWLWEDAYNDGMPVEIHQRGGGDLTIVAYNEGGYNCTAIVLEDLLQWTASFMPELYSKYLPKSKERKSNGQTKNQEQKD